MEKFILNNVNDDTFEVLGHKMFLHRKNMPDVILHGVHDPTETALVKREINRGDIVLDLGAHIGYYTLIFAECVGETGKVFAFEPDPTNFAILKKNIEINGFKNVILSQKAVSNRTGITKLHLSEQDHMAHRIHEWHSSNNSIEVETIALDDYFKDYNGEIDFIKMDIEGAEIKAIQGMHSLLQRNKQLKIILEFNPPVMKESGLQPEKLPTMLEDYGFELYNISERTKKIEHIDTAQLSEMSSKMLKKFRTAQTVGSQTNLLCVRE
ncbi:MAG: FkbM family methyltransferase [Candidatus Nitrosomirales archaeon]